MAIRKRKSFLFKFFIAILTIVVIFAIILGTGYFYVKTTYGIDIIQTYKQLKSLNNTVDESKYTEKFADTDMQSVKGIINNAFGGTEVITYNETDGYAITDRSSFQSLSLSDDIKLNSKECGALLNLLMQSSAISTMNLGNIDVDFSLIQVGISDDTAENTINFNSVVKIGMTGIKSNFNMFPLSLLANIIPDNLYISATVKVTKTGTFDYTISSGNVVINNLSKEDTASLLNTLNAVVEIGSGEELSQMINEAFVNALIGNETKGEGFAYSLIPLAQDFNFGTDDNVFKFIIEKA